MPNIPPSDNKSQNLNIGHAYRQRDGLEPPYRIVVLKQVGGIKTHRTTSTHSVDTLPVSTQRTSIWAYKV